MWLNLVELSVWVREVACSNRVIPTVCVAELVDAPDCGSGLCGFESRRTPRL